MFFSTGPPAWPEPTPAAAPLTQCSRAPHLSPSLPTVRTVPPAPHPHPDPCHARAGVAREAERRVGSAARLYYPRRPAMACASFVSRVLTVRGLLPHLIRSATALKEALLRRGWRRNCPKGTSVTRVAKQHLKPGDVLLFARPGGRPRHCGLSLGGDRFVAISSRAGRVERWRLSEYGRIYATFESLRYAR